ncbi:peptidase family C50-domain-containing protein [Coniochaeta sp. 2T2.1]|nr:peptidase family C50-domain-containing protein [Coniochaeta sp. 2T2.1]
MASLLSDADAVKAAVASVSTCSAATLVSLKGLLLPNDNTASSIADPRPTKTTRPTKPTTTGIARGTKKTKTTGDGDNGELTARARAALATQVVNATLKALGDAAKPVPPTPAKKLDDGGLVKAATRNALRRSNSMPMTPLQPRNLNRVSTSPVKTARPAPTTNSTSTNCLSTVECARVAFHTLRTLLSSGSITLPELQLEAGMSSLVGKLIALGLHEQAVKELRILKRRLDESSKVETSKNAHNDNMSSTSVLPELLDFSKVKASSPAMSLIVTTQIQVLRILSAIKKPSLTASALPQLRRSNPASVISLLLSIAKQPSADKDKLARQMESVSQLLLSLSPSVSSSQDNIATDPRLSVSPDLALEIQGLGLEARLLWWKLAGHQGDIDKDILSPLSRCLVACVRRLKGQTSIYRFCHATTNGVYELIPTLPKPTSTRSPQSTIHELLATLARDSGNLTDAVQWATKLRDSVSSETDSAAKICSIAAQLLAYQLKLDPMKYLEDSALLNEVILGVGGSLRGDTTELDELLGNINSLRRAVIAILLGHVKDGKGAGIHPTASTKEPLESFVLQCPRFCLRWLGKPPTPTSSTKDYLRYDQRRQLLLQSIHHTFDSAFVLAKSLLGEKRLSWDVLETMLADSLLLLEYIGELPMPADTTSYYVKISHFYYMKYDHLRQRFEDHSALKALRRSVDCVKSRPAKDKTKAQLIIKFERMAELCKSLGRAEEALGALQGIRNCLVEDGVLGQVAAALEKCHPQVAWGLSYEANVLSRTLCSIARIEAVWMDWTVDFPEAEQAAALEHRLHLVLLGGEKRPQVALNDPTVDALLRIYIPTRFPVRRLRTLLRLLSASVGDNDLQSNIRSIAADAVQLGQNDIGEDAPLAPFLPHMKALFASIVGLIDGYPDTQSFEQTLSVWKGMLDSDPTRAGLESCIDGITDLLAHLESVADYLRLKGEQRLLDIVVHLSADISRIVEGPRPEQFVASQTALAHHFIDTGSSVQAAGIFDAAEASLSKSEDVPGYVVAQLQLSHADFFITSGSPAKANEYLARAATSFASAQSVHRISRSRKKLLLAYASYLRGLAALELGSSHHALVYLRDTVRTLFAEWARMESLLTDTDDVKALSADDSAASVVISATEKTSGTSPVITAPDFWTYFRHLFRALMQLSALYAHLGMFPETTYYADQAEKMARATRSSHHIAQVATWMAFVNLKAGKLDKSSEFVGQARESLLTGYYSCASVSLLCQMASVYRGLQDFEAEAEMVGMAEEFLSKLSGKTTAAEAATQVSDTVELETKMAKLDIKETKPAARSTRRAAKPLPPVKRPVSRTTVARGAKPKAPAVPSEPVLPPEDPYMASFRAAVLVQKAMSLLGRKDWAMATSILREVAGLPRLIAGLENKQVAMAASLLGESLESMARDSVFSVVHDSTLSFPTLAASAHDRDRLSLTKTSPPRKGRSATSTLKKDTAKDSLPAGFLLSLLEAQEILLGAHAEVVLTGDASLLHRVGAMLQTVTLVLSTISAKFKPVGQIGHAASSADLARNLTWRRERKVLLQEKQGIKLDGNEWPAVLSSPEDSRRTSLGPSTTDLHKFQRDYIDILPKNWTAISISLSETHDLCITRLQTGQTPFVIRLPLKRASSRDADTEVPGFEEVRAELLEIIQAANITCHDKRDMSVKGARTQWWANREALDERMRELLERIEGEWLNGFRGIFSQHQRRPDLLARFQKSFQNVLDKHLPSRRQVRGKKTRGAAAAATPTAKITLDPRILELFIGLGDATEEDCDFDEALTDLLYFVVDILQFHGERNAYDEVDFDAMVVETFDALHAYHAAAKAAADTTHGSGAHTILVLDKALHTFPWESLPCMQGNAVSRVPSLACLRRQILEAKPPSTSPSNNPSTDNAHPRAGHHIPLTQGTYMVNPSSDLPSTETTFSAPLQSHLPTWKSFISHKPTEEDFSAALSTSPCLLYFGHGSGAQYIKGRTVRRLDPGCKAVALLWGCSSASLADCGEFEVHGTAWNYLMAGCPAVAGTLWDVTDRDIDRFAARTLEGWGMVPPGAIVVDSTAKKAGKKTVAKGGSGGGGGSTKKAEQQQTDLSLVEAVSAARDGVCRFRYLTAAAVVVYGIPVYVDK